MIFNVIAQLLLGVPLEMVHKWWRVLTIYMLGVLSGSLLTSITDPTVKLVGASGGVYSVITAHFATLLIVNKLFFYLISVAELPHFKIPKLVVSSRSTHSRTIFAIVVFMRSPEIKIFHIDQTFLVSPLPKPLI